MYAICGATGNIGRAIAEKLLAMGEDVRAIGRSAERMRSLEELGAEVFVADLKDTAALTHAFTDAEAVYAMIPPNLTAPNIRAYQNEIGQSIATAIKKSGVRYVVNLSSIGAHLKDGVGVVSGLHDQEQRLNGLIGVNVYHLRPGFFMENHLWQVETVKQYGMMATAQNLDLRVPHIATSDIADYAVERLTKLDFQGKFVRELLGPADLSANEIAAAIGRAIGKDDLKYKQVSYDDARNQFLKVGVSPSVADGFIELYQAFNNGTARHTEPRSPENSAPTTIYAFSETFARLYKR
jgi:uncharacterized protein YbjT (DUF2867 family)